MLHCHELVVSYGHFVAVDNVSFTVRPGEIFGLLGPNGAGKTSVIRALTTILPLTSGTAVINGYAITDPISVRACIGVLPESNGYPGTQTGPSYLRFYGRLFGLTEPEASRRADRLLAQLGLAGNHQPIATYSRGMRQRLGLCRALINDPAVLFLDEPTLGLDPAGKEEIMAHLARTAVDNATSVILCSHLLDEVERVCDRVGIMDKGRIVAAGTVDDVIGAAGIAGYGKVRVAPDDIGKAAKALRGTTAAANVSLDNGKVGDIEIELASVDGSRAAILRQLLDAGIEPRSFDLQGARLSDAFLALTGAPEEAIR